MKAIELADLHNLTERYIRLITQKAKDSLEPFITLGGVKYSFSLVAQNRGRPAYNYEIVKNEVVKKEIKSKNLNIALSDRQKNRLELKLRIVEEFNDYKQNRKGSVKEFIEYVQKHIDETYTQKKHFDWQREYKKGGARALIDKRGVKKGETRVLSSEHQRYLIMLFRANAAGGVNYTQLWEELHREDAKMKGYDFLDWKQNRVKNICDRGVVQRFIANYYEKRVVEWTLVTQGEDMNKSLNQPAFGSRKSQYVVKNQCWEIDSSPADVIIYEDGRQIRPDILAVKDCYSGRCVAILAENSNTMAIIRLLWKAISVLGMPQSIKGDNGKDYVSRQFQMLLSNLGIKYIKATAYAGDEKGQVERNFRTIQHSYMSVLAGYIGHNVARRQKIEQQTSKKDRKAKDEFGNIAKTQTPSSQLLNWREFDDKLQEAVMLWEIDKKRRVGASPVELWNKCLEAPTTIEYENFLMYAGGYVKRVVQKDAVNFDGRKYESSFLHKLRGQDIYVVENIDNIAEIFIFDSDGSFIGKAFDKTLGTMTKEDYMKMKKEFVKETKELQKVINDDKLTARGRATMKTEYVRLKDEHKQSQKPIEPKKLDFNEIKEKSRNRNLPNFDEATTIVVEIESERKSLYSDMAIDYD